MFRTIVKNFWMLLPAAMFTVALGLSGCSSDDNGNPMAPGGEEEPEIRTPASLRITSITVTSFDSVKNNGDTWDWDPFSAGPRRADLYLKVETDGRVVYISDTRTDAEPSGQHGFPGSQPARSGGLPVSIPYGGSFKVTLMDDDGILAHDTITSHLNDVGTLYGQNNETSLNKVVMNSDATVRIQGNWVY